MIDLKINLDAYALEGEERAEYMKTRSNIPFSVRWYFEGVWQVQGELIASERKFVYDTIRKLRPESVYEVGTREGGGSTYFIGQALWENGKGILRTAECNKTTYDTAISNFTKYLGYLLPHVYLMCGDGAKVFLPIPDLKENDLVFLDGDTDPQQTLDQYNAFLPHMKNGSCLMVHDWFRSGPEGKAVLLKPIIEKDPTWVLENNPAELGQDSPGLVLYRRRVV